MSEREKRTVEALTRLVAKLDAITESPEWSGLFTLARVHGMPWRGETFGPELEAAHAALNAEPEGGEK